jgi:hypothetical protein
MNGDAHVEWHLEWHSSDPAALWPYSMVAAVAGELKKAVESCVQHDLEPTNQARRCASLDRGLHETAGMLGA